MLHPHMYFGAKLYKAGLQMNLQINDISRALHIFHHACKAFSIRESDEMKYIMAISSLYTVAKCQFHPINLRGICIIFYGMIGNEKWREPEEDFTTLEKVIHDYEMLILRNLDTKFCDDISMELMLNYLNHLIKLIPSTVLELFEIPKACCALLTDFSFHVDSIKHDSKLVAIAVIHLVLYSYGIEVPGCSSVESLEWAQVFVPDITMDMLTPIIGVIRNQYGCVSPTLNQGGVFELLTQNQAEA